MRRRRTPRALTMRRMNSVDVGHLGLGLFVTLMMALQAAWYVGIAVMLWKIWKKVRHLPG
jgi:hypothetical protein